MIHFLQNDTLKIQKVYYFANCVDVLYHFDTLRFLPQNLEKSRLTKILEKIYFSAFLAQ